MHSAESRLPAVYPWSAVVGQDALKQALLLCAIDPAIGGVLVQGPRGVAKTTLARALGELVQGDFVELPLGATEERVVGTLDLESALRAATVQFAPGLLARAHGGVLYVDEINLLPDLLVDLLLDAAATGQNRVERDGVSHTHPARFVLIGTMNPEEGELRPQLIDRFGLSVSASNQIPPPERAAIVTQRLEFDADPAGFIQRFADEQARLIARCLAARARALTIPLGAAGLERATQLCYAAGVEGVRADLAMLRAARAHAAWNERAEITASDIDAVSEFALAHRRSGAAASRANALRPGGSGGGGSGAASGGAGANGGGIGPRDGVASGQESGSGAPTAFDRRTDLSDAARASRAPMAFGRGANPSDGVAAAANGATSGAPTAFGRDADARDRALASRDAGELAPVPVPVLRIPALPAWFAPARTLELESRRRGRGKFKLGGGSAARARSPAPNGPIDWFATLQRSRRPRRDQIVRRARCSPPRQLWIIALDCSASMLRGGALAAAKGLALALESSARRAGAHVALLCFRGSAAQREVDTGATHSHFRRSLAAQGGGGGTPLGSALEEARALAGARPFRSGKIQKHLVILTDGRAREPLAELVAPANVHTLVIDCERNPVRLDRAPLLAAALGADYLPLDPR